jgi:thiol-disulfide isomerase/thioredoxin
MGSLAPNFALRGVDNRTHTLASFANKQVLVVMIWCNHCPYVQAYEDRVLRLQADYAGRSVQFVAINPNDNTDYPEDSFEEMVKRARVKSYNFPYLRDESQQVARAYNAICTPQIFVFDRDRKLRYHGRIDDSRDPALVRSHDLRDALDALVAGKQPAVQQTRPFGCSVKWKRA